MDWSNVYKAEKCQDKFRIFDTIMNKLIEKHFPKREVKVYPRDKPWITEKFKRLISDRQKAFRNNNRQKYNRLRNEVIHMSKTLKPKYYQNKMRTLSEGNTKDWWRHIKEVTGCPKSDNTANFQNIANLLTNGDIQELANEINKYFQSISSDLPPLTEDLNPLPPTETPDRFLVNVEEVEKQLMKVKRGKAAGPDEIQAWMLRDLAPVLAPPITAICNSSIRKSFVPDKWKKALVTPIPKNTPIVDIKKDIRPISLTSLIAKELERIVILHLKESLREGRNQFGNKKDVSTTNMLVEILHHWYMASDNNDNIRIVLIDFSKAFDRINNRILIDKIRQCGIPEIITRWIISFFTNRFQQVRIGHHLSDPLHMKGILPQGALLGMEGFITMARDLASTLPLYKYLDDGTIFEVVKNDEINDIQKWVNENDMKINEEKTKEMVISFNKPYPQFAPIIINGKTIKRIHSTKFLGHTVQNNQKWDTHVDKIITKANIKLHFLRRLKRSGASEKDLITFYKAIVRSSLEYSTPSWSTNISKT